MNDRQRRRYLDSIERSSNVIGEEIPERLTVQGTTIDLRSFVFECRRLEEIPESERDRIEEMKRELQRERLERKHRIEREEITHEEAERIVESVHGIDRALNALDGLDTPSYSEQLRRKKLEDARDLLAMIRQLPD